jgi:CRISPR-associated protein Cas1
MSWRSVIVSSPAHLSCKLGRMQIAQGGEIVSVPLEDIAVLVIDHPQVTLTAHLLSACADAKLTVITVNKSHIPNGIFHPYLPHSRALKVMRQQLAMTQPQKKRLWQTVIRQKLINQAAVLADLHLQTSSEKLSTLVQQVRSGDPDNYEALGAQIYFSSLFGKGFNRSDDNALNAALNYGYSIGRGAIARSLVSYGFLPAFGLHHCSEQNAFNLADDLLEPYRPVVDLFVCRKHRDVSELDSGIKASLVGLLHHDIPRIEHGDTAGTSTVLALIDATVVSLSQAMGNQQNHLVLPAVPNALA